MIQIKLVGMSMTVYYAKLHIPNISAAVHKLSP
jgi:hypothetical protein